MKQQWAKNTDRQTDRQTNSLTPYTGGCGFFLQVKFSTSLLASLAGGLKLYYVKTFIVHSLLKGQLSDIPYNLQ